MSDGLHHELNHGRRQHYAGFYGLSPLPDDGRPILIVHGNCQAESVRVLLAGAEGRTPIGSEGGPWHAVRIPPVHEIEDADEPHLAALLTRTRLLLSQPVRNDYRNLRLGTDQLAAHLPAGARVLRFPIVRHLGLHPYQAIVRHPSDPAAVPAGVPYHDLRILTAVRDGLGEAAAIDRATQVTAAEPALREVGERSLAELDRREQSCDVGVSDLIPGLAETAVHTVNHPGNALLIALARRIQTALGVPATAADPGRELLGGIRAPLQAAVLEALGLTGAPREHWLVDGGSVAPALVVQKQLPWYAAHPQFVAAGLERHAERIGLLGL
jgi:hypothetical protein